MARAIGPFWLSASEPFTIEVVSLLVLPTISFPPSPTNGCSPYEEWQEHSVRNCSHSTGFTNNTGAGHFGSQQRKTVWPSSSYRSQVSPWWYAVLLLCRRPINEVAGWNRRGQGEKQRALSFLGANGNPLESRFWPERSSRLKAGLQPSRFHPETEERDSGI